MNKPGAKRKLQDLSAPPVFSEIWNIVFDASAGILVSIFVSSAQ